MSIAPVRLAFILGCCLFSFGGLCAAQTNPTYNCRVTRIEPEARSLNVRCEVTAPRRRVEIVFRDRFAGMTNLSARIKTFDVGDENGSRFPAENLGSGRYAIKPGDAELGRSIIFSYRVNLAAPLEPGQYALASSLGFRATANAGIEQALGRVALPSRVLLFGSLYLAGDALEANGQVPY